MNKDKLIAKQQFEIENLKETKRNYEYALECIHGALFSIGAPLNDNVLGFNSEQKRYLHYKIADFIPAEIFEDDDE